MALSALKAGGVGALIGGLVAGMIAWNMGHEAGDAVGYKRAEVKAETVIGTKNATIKVIDGDLRQCREANQNYHSAVGAQLQRINAELLANMERQAVAEKKGAASDARMLDAATRSADNSAKAREAIQNAAEECLRRGVSAEFVGVLNTILEGGSGTGVDASGDAVPGK
jgi:hypothetical protein